MRRKKGFDGQWLSGITLVAVCALLLVCALMIPPANAGEVTFTGCIITRVAYMDEMAKVYEKKTGTKILLSGGGATKGIRAASGGSADIGGTCRHWVIDAAGQKHVEEKDAELVQVAWDALVPMVNPANPVNNITLDNWKKVMDGEITSWKDIGGLDKKIAVIEREEYYGSGYMFKGLAYGDPDHQHKVRTLNTGAAGAEEKAETLETAIGVDGISAAKKTKVKILTVDGVEASKENIASGKYPLFRPLYLALNKKARPEARKFVDFILSPEGQDVISKQGTVNLEEGKNLVPLWEKQKSKLRLK